MYNLLYSPCDSMYNLLYLHWKLSIVLTLIQMAGGIYDSWNFEQKQVKVALSKNTFYPRSIPHKMC